MITLYPYQTAQYLFCTKSGRDVLIQSPTGSGKTTTASAVASYYARKGYTVLLLVTQDVVEESFHAAAIQQIDTGHGIESCAGIIARAKTSATSVGAIREHLESGRGKVLLATQQAMVRCDREVVQLATKKCVVIVDEFHHSTSDDLYDNGTAIGESLRWFREQGATVIGLTATPFRADCLNVTTNRTKVHTRTMLDHMAEGFCPKNVEATAVSYAGSLDSIDEASTAMIKTWCQQGRPKLIIRVPHIPSGALRSIEIIVERFRKEGARVLNVSGCSTEDKTRIRQAMAHEGECSFRESRYDVIVGCRRVGEAFNWPSCCAVYSLSCPVSANLCVQLLGRAMRRRDGSCSAKWRDKASVVFFCPSESPDRDVVSDRHMAKTAIMCSLLSDIQYSHIYSAMSPAYRIDQSLPGKQRSSRSETPEIPSIESIMCGMIKDAVANGRQINDESVMIEVRRIVRKSVASRAEQNAMLQKCQAIVEHVSVARIAELPEAISDVHAEFIEAARQAIKGGRLLRAFTRSSMFYCQVSLDNMTIRSVADGVAGAVERMHHYTPEDVAMGVHILGRGGRRILA
jgi:superfamily II DNA or RNA helicase